MVIKRLLLLWLMIAISMSSAVAEVVVLRTGQKIRGEILLNNDDIVIIQKKDGTRYQYPKTEVVSLQDDTIIHSTTESSTVARTKSVAFRIAAAGGIAHIPHYGWGGTTEAHAMVGTNNLFNRQLFLGGSVGYRGAFKDKMAYSWIPLQLVFHMPIAELPSANNRPLVGASFGYSFATNKQWGSGLCAGVEVGWWHRIGSKNSLTIALAAQWQQTRIDIVESIEGNHYTNRIGCNILGLGLKIGIQF